MSFDGFMAFDPYRTFAEGEQGSQERIFLRADGTPTATWHDLRHDGHGYLSSLWRTGCDAYATVAEKAGVQSTAEYFKAAAAYLREFERECAPNVQQLINESRLTA